VLLLPWGWLLQQRGVVAGRAFGKYLFPPRGRPTKLRDIEHEIDHVICATHLNAGEHFYFSGRFVYSYRFGWGKPGSLPVHAAVQASAAFPGGFPPTWMRTRRFGFGGTPESTGKLPWFVTLTDGGVYDNMADEWPAGVARRAASPHAPSDLKIPSQLVVVNASAGLGWSNVRSLRIPFFGEFLALTRDISVLFDNSASLRMRGLVGWFGSRRGIQGALVNIEQSPFRIPDAFKDGSSQAAQRARTVIAKLGDTRKTWKQTAKDNTGVKTTLSSLGTEDATRLLFHGYVLAMANLHTILDFPLLDVPDQRSFEPLVG
jgi:hypothetical protein